MEERELQFPKCIQEHSWDWRG